MSATIFGFKYRNSRLQQPGEVFSIESFIGKKAVLVGNDQEHIPRVREVGPRVVHFGQAPLRHCEPDAASIADRGSHCRLRSWRPAWRLAWLHIHPYLN